SGAGRGRRRPACQAGRAGAGGHPAAHPAHRHPGAVRGGDRRPGRRLRHRPLRVPTARPSADHRAGPGRVSGAAESGEPAGAGETRSAEEVEAAGPTPARQPRSVYDVGREPDARFSLANERTALAWVRTSLAVVAGGVGLASLTRLADLSDLVNGLFDVLAAVLCMAGAGIAAFAVSGWRRREIAMRTGRPLPAPSALPWLAGVVALVGASLAIYAVVSAVR